MQPLNLCSNGILSNDAFMAAASKNSDDRPAEEQSDGDDVERRPRPDDPGVLVEECMHLCYGHSPPPNSRPTKPKMSHQVRDYRLYPQVCKVLARASGAVHNTLFTARIKIL